MIENTFFHTLPIQYAATFGEQFDYLIEYSQIKKNLKLFEKFLYRIRHHKGLHSSRIILDMGAGIGKAYSEVEYFKFVKKYSPDIFVLPDVLRDKAKTLKNFAMFQSYITDTSKVMLIAQGKDKTELIDCIRCYRAAYDNILVGIPYRAFEENLGDPLLFAFMRIRFVLRISSLFPDVKFHLLGLWHPCELTLLSLSNVISCDSSYAYIMQKARSLVDIRDPKATVSRVLKVNPKELLLSCYLLESFVPLKGGDINVRRRY